MTALPPNPSSDATPVEKRRNFWLKLMILCFLVIGLAWFLYWLFFSRFYVYTEDAYVTGNQVALTPQVAASVKTIYADETDFVQQGQLIIELDVSDFEIRFQELKEQLDNTVKEVASLFLNVEAKKSQVELRNAEYRQAKRDFQHREPLVKTGAVSKEEFEIYQTRVQVAEDSIEIAKKELAIAEMLVVGTTTSTHPRVQQAAWNLKQAYFDLVRCQILSPASGYIAKRVAQVGDRVKIGETLLYIVPLHEIWIEANYKETQLADMRMGQKVNFTADMYGKAVKFRGEVIGFQPGSGNAFSLLPPENASGNWIKIVQRVPVRIRIHEDQLKQHPLFLGLSTRVTTDIHDRSGAILSTCPTEYPIYSTHIYQDQWKELEQVESLISQIIIRATSSTDSSKGV